MMLDELCLALIGARREERAEEYAKFYSTKTQIINYIRTIIRLKQRRIITSTWRRVPFKELFIPNQLLWMKSLKDDPIVPIVPVCPICPPFQKTKS